MEDLKKAIDKSQALSPFKDQLLLDITPGGPAHPDRRPAEPADVRQRQRAPEALHRDHPHELARYLNTVPNRLSLTGHTDAAPYAGRRAGAPTGTCRATAPMLRGARWKPAGLSTDKTARVVGLSSSVLFDRSDPRNPINRRISIIVMTRQAERDALKTDTPASVSAGERLPGPSRFGPGSPQGVARPKSRCRLRR